MNALLQELHKLETKIEVLCNGMITKDELLVIEEDLNAIAEDTTNTALELHNKVDHLEMRVDNHIKLINDKISRHNKPAIVRQVYVEYGKHDHENYVSDDDIRPLPRYYR